VRMWCAKRVLFVDDVHYHYFTKNDLIYAPSFLLNLRNISCLFGNLSRTRPLPQTPSAAFWLLLEDNMQQSSFEFHRHVLEFHDSRGSIVKTCRRRKRRGLYTSYPVPRMS
jgi:hypothetical protein